jgi:DNA-directed RNA polymerase subunit beta'
MIVDKTAFAVRYNGVIVSELLVIYFEELEQGQSFMVEIDEQTGFQEVISESRAKINLTLLVYGKDGR